MNLFSKQSLLPLFLVLLLTITTTTSVAATSIPSQPSDGITLQDTQSSILLPTCNQPWYHSNSNFSASSTFRLSESTPTCEETFGFMPCSDTAFGNVLLMAVYSYIMYTGATFLVAGCELLEERLGPGVIGGLLLPILTTLPDVMLVLASGVSGSTETAQSQILVGMALLAGSTVLDLTLIWGTCAVLGKCDLDHKSNAIDGEDNKGFHLTGSGVSTDIWTSYAAMIMTVSVIPFIAVQISQIFSTSAARHNGVLISLIISIYLLISYCLYQVFHPNVQRRRIAYAELKHFMMKFIRHLKKHSLGRLFTADGRPNDVIIERLFHKIDMDQNNHISEAELRAFLIGVELNENKMVEHIIKNFDIHGDKLLDLNKFKAGISKWLADILINAQLAVGLDSDTKKHIDYYHEEVVKREHNLSGAEVEVAVTEYETEKSENKKHALIKSILMLLFGTLLAACVSDPLVDAVNEFSTATSIPVFFIAFIVLPFATCTSDAIPSFAFVRRKKKRSTSLTFSMLYGSVTMNNVLSLSVFLALVYFRGLTWNFSSEMLVIPVVCVVIGGLASFRTSFPLWTSVVAFSLYPFSLLLVYVLDYVFGWS